MMTNVDHIANASERGVRQALEFRENKPQLAILISCIGRNLVLNQRVEEEIEEIIDVLEGGIAIFCFYSYREITPFHGQMCCQ